MDTAPRVWGDFSQRTLCVFSRRARAWPVLVCGTILYPSPCPTVASPPPHPGLCYFVLDSDALGSDSLIGDEVNGDDGEALGLSMELIDVPDSIGFDVGVTAELEITSSSDVGLIDARCLLSAVGGDLVHESSEEVAGFADDDEALESLTVVVAEERSRPWTAWLTTWGLGLPVTTRTTTTSLRAARLKLL